jgi:hypothetical protein
MEPRLDLKLAIHKYSIHYLSIGEKCKFTLIFNLGRWTIFISTLTDTDIIVNVNVQIKSHGNDVLYYTISLFLLVVYNICNIVSAE